MLQVFEYYTNHHMKKAFESVFGCVTCLPGCFTMYRVFSSDGRALIAQDNVFAEYSRNDIESLHEKNLYFFGEDRMLTTLLLKNFPDMRLSFVPEAAAGPSSLIPSLFCCRSEVEVESTVPSTTCWRLLQGQNHVWHLLPQS